MLVTFRHGRARTQLSLVPRSIQKKPAASGPATKRPVPSTSANGNTETSTDRSEENADSKPTSKMSNEDFRNMLLKK